MTNTDTMGIRERGNIKQDGLITPEIIDVARSYINNKNESLIPLLLQWSDENGDVPMSVMVARHILATGANHYKRAYRNIGDRRGTTRDHDDMTLKPSSNEIDLNIGRRQGAAERRGYGHAEVVRSTL